MKIPCGSAAVTSDESSIEATVRKRGKAEPVGGPRSQKTCFFMLIKSPGALSGVTLSPKRGWDTRMLLLVCCLPDPLVWGWEGFLFFYSS